MSRASTEFLGHSYYGSSPSVISDMIRVFNNEHLPRGLEKAVVAAGAYWIMMPR